MKQATPKKTALLLMICALPAMVPSGYAAAKGERKTLTLGAVLSMTGKYATAGAHAKRGYDLAVKQLNARGGIDVAGTKYRLRILYQDDRSMPKRGAELAEKLIRKRGIRFMLGPYSSGLTKAIAPVTEKYRVPMVEGNGAARSLFTKGYKYLFAVLSTSDYYLREAIKLAAAEAKRSGRKLGSLRVAIAVEPDPFSMDVRFGALEDARRLGMKIVVDDRLPRTLDDMSQTLARVGAFRPDILIVSGHSKGAALGIRQIRDQEISIPMLAMTHCESAEIVKKFGRAAEGTLCAAQWAPSMSYRGPLFGSARSYADAFKVDYGYEPPYQAAESTATVQVLADAIVRAGSLNTRNVRDALAATDIMTFFGPVKFDSSGKNIAKPMVLRQVQNGKYIPVAPQRFASGRLVHPRP